MTDQRKPSVLTPLVSGMAILVLLFAAYMGAYYLSMPRDYAERGLWELDIIIKEAEGEYPFFGPAQHIDEWVDLFDREKIGDSPKSNPAPAPSGQ